MRDHRYRAPALASLAALWLMACASMARVGERVDELIAEGRYEQAGVVLDDSRDVYGVDNQLLWELERGMVLQYAGRFEDSNRAFEAAKRIADERYTRRLSRELGSYLVNDRVLPYAGDAFERALIHVFAALNYAQLGQRDAALVEARQLNHLLETFETDEGDRYTYRQDAFGRYLSGMLYEDAGDPENAYIAYWNALEAYERYEEQYATPIPRSLRRAAAGAAARLGGVRQAEFASRWGPVFPDAGVAPGMGRLVVLHFNGPSPRKREQFVDISFGSGWAYVNASTARGVAEEQLATARAVAASIPASETFRVAWPTIERSRYDIRSMMLRLPEGGRMGPAELVEDVGAIAIQHLEDRMIGIRARAIARAAIKYAIAKSVSAGAAGRNDPNERLVLEAVRVLITAVNLMTERADTRSWTAVPDEIRMLEVGLPQGRHALELRFHDLYGGLVAQRFREVEIRPAERSFVIVRTIR